MWSLLHAARDTPTNEAWLRLVRVCEPLLYGWLRCQDVQHADAEDLVQETLATLVLEAPTSSPSGIPVRCVAGCTRSLSTGCATFAAPSGSG